MSRTLHDDILDNGLSTFTTLAAGGTLKMTYCSEQPLTLADAITLFDGSANKYRITDEITLAAVDVTLASVTNGRQASFAAQTTLGAAVTVAGGDKHVAVYDATRLLLTTTEQNDIATSIGATANIQALNVPLTVTP